MVDTSSASIWISFVNIHRHLMRGAFVVPLRVDFVWPLEEIFTVGAIGERPQDFYRRLVHYLNDRG